MSYGITILGLDVRSRTPEPPYYWQSKEAIRRIREYMKERDQWPKVSSRLCFYSALCEMASNRESESFCVSQKALADLCGYSDRTQREMLCDLEGAGVIRIFGPPSGVQDKKTYALLSMRSEVASARSEVDVNKASLPTLEEQKKKQQKEREEALGLEAAIARYRDDSRFAHKDVEGSLTKRVREGRIMTPSGIETWLTREDKERVQPKPSKPKSKPNPEPEEQPISLALQKEYADQLAKLKAQMNGAKAAEEIDK